MKARAYARTACSSDIEVESRVFARASRPSVIEPKALSRTQLALLT